jgi:hypothetical protein
MDDAEHPDLDRIREAPGPRRPCQTVHRKRSATATEISPPFRLPCEGSSCPLYSAWPARALNLSRWSAAGVSFIASTTGEAGCQQ